MLYYPNKQNPIDYKNKRNKTNWKKATSTNRRRDKWKYCCIRITSTKYKSRIKWKANRTLGYPLETVAWVTPWQSLLDYRIEARLKLNTALWKNLVVDNIDKQSFEGYVVCFLNRVSYDVLLGSSLSNEIFLYWVIWWGWYHHHHQQSFAVYCWTKAYPKAQHNTSVHLRS